MIMQIWMAIDTGVSGSGGRCGWPQAQVWVASGTGVGGRGTGVDGQSSGMVWEWSVMLRGGCLMELMPTIHLPC